MPKFGMKVPHLRCDLHTSFKVKRSKFRVTDGRGHTVSAEPGGHTACFLFYLSFLPRNAMNKRRVPLSGVCPSVCPPRSCILSKRINVFSKFFLPSGSHTILVLLCQTLWQYSNRNPLNRGIECSRCMQKSRFSTSISLHRVLSVLRPPSVVHTAALHCVIVRSGKSEGVSK